VYYSLVWGNPCAVHLDPIEKKPFFHVLPSSRAYSVATAGCNLQCKFCQNWEISQATPEDLLNHDMPPETIVEQAIQSGARSIAYTYVEPTVFYEYMVDVARLARKAGLLNVYHSNAFINPIPLRELCDLLDAANFDLKGFSEEYYRSMCSGQLAPVLESLKICRGEGVHIELTNLVVPTRNEDETTIRRMCRWITKELGADTPLHFSRFYPLYKLRNLPPTPVSTLERARAAAREEGLNYVYIGNVPAHEGEHTFCPRCGGLVIQRIGFMVGEVRMKEGACTACGHRIPGIWS
jgi:pyruvate formate lyase activating enzyme